MCDELSARFRTDRMQCCKRWAFGSLGAVQCVGVLRCAGA